MSQERGSPCLPGKKRRGRPKITALDLFAGAGGFSTGAEQAGAHVLFAINHYAPAVSIHAENHPYTTHCHEDVFRFNWNRAPLAQVVLASPSCKAHSTAATKGGKGKRGAAPQHDVLRVTPWAVLDCVENQVDRGNMPIVVVENVLEFKRKWRFYEAWKAAICGMDYACSENVICSLDYGVPQRRTRLFVIFTPTRHAFDLKTVTRACPRSVNALKAKDMLPFKPFIHTGAGEPPENWVPIDRWSPPSVGKKARGRERKIKKRLGKVPPAWYWANTDSAPLSASEPCGTITAESGNQLYLVKGGRMRRFSVHELRGAMGFPKDYVLPSSLAESGRLLGNAVVPQVARSIVKQLIARA